MHTALIVVFLLAQAFVRPTLPKGKEWVTKNLRPLAYQGNFTVPKSGQWTLKYESLYPGTYDGKILKASPQFCETPECNGNRTPIYVVEESYDHITVKAKPDTKWFYSCIIAIPGPKALPKAVTQ